MTNLNTQIDNQLVSDTARPRSVVASGYKAKYAERAKSARGKKGVDRRVVAQSNGDWLALELAARLRPTKKSRLNVALLEAILDANGVEHLQWSRTTKNWQGRLRMSGGLALRTVVAENGALILPEGTELAAPRAWCERWIR